MTAVQAEKQVESELVAIDGLKDKIEEADAALQSVLALPKIAAKMDGEARRLAHHYNRVRLDQLKRILDNSGRTARSLLQTVSRHPSRVPGDRKGAGPSAASLAKPRKSVTGVLAPHSWLELGDEPRYDLASSALDDVPESPQTRRRKTQLAKQASGHFFDDMSTASLAPMSEAEAASDGEGAVRTGPGSFVRPCPLLRRRGLTPLFTRRTLRPTGAIANMPTTGASIRLRESETFDSMETASNASAEDAGSPSRRKSVTAIM